jgi:hypothetical protein
MKLTWSTFKWRAFVNAVMIFLDPKVNKFLGQERYYQLFQEGTDRTLHIGTSDG